MKWQYAILAFALFSAASAETYEEEEGDPRLGYIAVGSDGTTSITFNATSIQNAVILGLFILVLGALILPLFGISLGSLFGSDRGDTGYGYGFDQATYHQGFESYNSFSKRSSNQGWGFNAMKVLQCISMLQEVYEKFDYNDVECQKRLICEVLKEEEYFGVVSRNLQSGFELAKYLEMMNMPDEFRELLDEYMDASERSLEQKQCEEFFQCPYSLKDAVKRNFSGNSL